MGTEWPRVRLGEVVDLLTGFPFRSALYTSDLRDALLLRGDNIAQGVLRWDGAKRWSLEKTENLEPYALSEGDLVLAMDRPWIEAGLKYGAVKADDLPAFLVQRVARLRGTLGLDRRYLRYLIGSRSFTDHILAVQTGTAVPHISAAQIREFEFCLPPIAEQAAMGQILGTLDDKIELNRRMSETLEEMARAIFIKAIASLDTTHEPLPALISINPDRPLRKGSAAPYLDMANMPTRGHCPINVVERPVGSGMRFINGDTLVARITPCLENGKTAFVDFLKEGETGWGSTEYIVLRPKPPLPPEFAYCLARSDRFREFAIQSMTGSSGRQRVPASSLTHFMVPRLSTEEATAFGRQVSPLLQRVAVASRESKTLAELRDTLLPKLISGELRVRQAERAAAAVL